MKFILNQEGFAGVGGGTFCGKNIERKNVLFVICNLQLDGSVEKRKKKAVQNGNISEISNFLTFQQNTDNL